MSATSSFTAVLMELASEVRHRILDDRLSGLTDPGEVTHTQNFVSRLARLTRPLGLTVAAREVPKTVESQLLGADVALWVLGSDAVNGLHLQAKRLYPNDAYYDLGHETDYGRQVDLLIDGAASCGAGAAYMFYNGLASTQPSGSACCLADFSPDRNGITVAPAVSVEPFVGKPKNYLPRGKIEDLCTPIACIARCCGQTLANDEDDLAAVLGSWLTTHGAEDTGGVDVTEVPEYAQPLFASLAASLELDQLPRIDQSLDDPSVETVLAVAIAPRRV